MFLGFPGGSAGKESACNAGDLGPIPGLGRSPGEGLRLPTPVFSPGEFHGLYSPRGHKEQTERLSLSDVSSAQILMQNQRLWAHSTPCKCFSCSHTPARVCVCVCVCVFTSLMFPKFSQKVNPTVFCHLSFLRRDVSFLPTSDQYHLFS